MLALKLIPILAGSLTLLVGVAAVRTGTPTDADTARGEQAASLRVNLPGIARATPVTLAPQPPTSIANALAYGDKLKISFFETMSVSFAGNNSKSSVATVFPRMDLSAEYVVDDLGNISLPRLGQIEAVGRGIDELRYALGTAFTRVTGRASEVDIAIAERQPIYVTGTVRSPGSFKHAPGMIVMQVLAQSGAQDIDPLQTSRTIEGFREADRIRQHVSRRNRLLVKRARLVALRDKLETLSIPQTDMARLSASATAATVKTLIEAESSVLKSEQRNRTLELSLSTRQVEIAKIEVAALRKRSAQYQLQLEAKNARIAELEGVASRGHLARSTLDGIRIEVADLTGRKDEQEVAVAQAERRLIEAEIAHAKLRQGFTLEIEKELAASSLEIDECDSAIASMHSVAEALRTGRSDTPGHAAAKHPLLIIRRTPAGYAEVKADPMTPLMPGDVLQVASRATSIR